MAGSDEHDFEDFFRSELRSVTSTVYRITGDSGLSEEITQDAFVRALARWRRLRHYDRPGAWVRRVAIRDAVRAVKRHEREKPLSSIERPVAAPPPSNDEALTAAVGALPPQQRAAVALYYLEDRPTADVADLLDCSEATVRSHLRRARQQLAAALRDERQEEVGDVRG